MTYEERLRKLAQQSADKLGSLAELARYMAVTRQQAHDWKTGKSKPTGAHVLKMQDLLRKVACVLLAWGAIASPDPAQAALNVTPVAPSPALGFSAKPLSGIHIVCDSADATLDSGNVAERRYRPVPVSQANRNRIKRLLSAPT